MGALFGAGKLQTPRFVAKSAKQGKASIVLHGVSGHLKIEWHQGNWTPEERDTLPK